MNEDLQKSNVDVPYASRAELSDLANNIAKLEANFSRVIDSLSKKKSVDVDEPKLMEVEAGPDDIAIPPSFRQAAEEILGKDFGIRVSYDMNGSGFLFSIIVPLEKSNAHKDYLAVYKQDIRTRSLTTGEGLAGVREWCIKVRKNLERSGVKFPIN